MCVPKICVVIDVRVIYIGDECLWWVVGMGWTCGSGVCVGGRLVQDWSFFSECLC